METTVTIQAGAKLPGLTLPRLTGGDLSFAELRGKRALLFFWGSW